MVQKKSDISDKSNNEQKEKFESGYFGYHVILILPTKKFIFDRDVINRMKFDARLVHKLSR